MTTEPALTKLHIDLPNHWATSGEALWARALGDDLYEIDNIPFHAYGLNCGDVVRATADAPSLKPEIREVIRPGGHRTVRVMFLGHASTGAVLFLNEVNARFGTSFEGRDSQYFAVDVPPEADYPGLCAYLNEQKSRDKLDYETCEARIPRGFDDVPDDSPRGPPA